MNEPFTLSMAGMILFAWALVHIDWCVKVRRFRRSIAEGTACKAKLWHRTETVKVLSIEPDGMLMVASVLDLSIHRVSKKVVYPL